MAQDAAVGPVSDDAFLGGRLHLLQSRTGLRAGIDAVFLAAAIPAVNGNDCQLLDVGTGSGIVGLSVLTRCTDVQLTGIDCDQDLVALARQNAERNGLEGRARFLTGDVLSGGGQLEQLGIHPNSFDHVAANPPFFNDGTVQHAPDPKKDRANVMAPGDLDVWMRFLAGVTCAGGMMTLVHKADSLDRVLTAIGNRFGGLRIFPLFPRADAPASRILVQGRKGARSPLVLLPGLVLHEADGSFTPKAKAILRDGEGLCL